MAAPSVTPGMGGAGTDCALAGPAARAAPPPARTASSRVAEVRYRCRMRLAPRHRLARNEVIMMSPLIVGGPLPPLFPVCARGRAQQREALPIWGALPKPVARRAHPVKP